MDGFGVTDKHVASRVVSEARSELEASRVQSKFDNRLMEFPKIAIRDVREDPEGRCW